MPTTIRQTIIAMLAVCLLLAGATTAASAGPRGSTQQDHKADRFYGNFELGILLFTGGGVEDICNGAPEPIVTARVFHQKNGTVRLRVKTQDVPIVLYHSPLGAPEFIDATCGAMFDGDPTTMPVQPFATGTAKSRNASSHTPTGFRNTATE